MRSTRWIVLFVMSLSLGCGEAEDPAEEDDVVDPEPVAPLEVATPEEGETAEGVDPPEVTAEGSEAAEGTEAAETPETMESLRARVAELEAQLASCQGATTPEGVDVPGADTSTTTASTAGDPRSGAAGERAGTQAGSRNNRGLLDTLLGPDEPAEGQGRQNTGTREEPRAIELPDPTRILLGP